MIAAADPSDQDFLVFTQSGPKKDIQNKQKQRPKAPLCEAPFKATLLSFVVLLFRFLTADSFHSVRSRDTLPVECFAGQRYLSVAAGNSGFADLEAQQQVAKPVFVNILNFVASRIGSMGTERYRWNIDLRRGVKVTIG